MPYFFPVNRIDSLQYPNYNFNNKSHRSEVKHTNLNNHFEGSMSMSKVRSYRFRPLKELNVIDDFLFAELCQDTPEGRSFVRLILETVLGRQIEVESVIAQRTIQGIDTDRHGSTRHSFGCVYHQPQKKR